MTDIELQRRKTICEIAGVNDIGELSDGFHTFNALYEQRMILFAALVRVYKDKAWKSYRHEDGKYCFGGGWFIVGIDTPEGSYTYHYENKYFNLFDCKVLDYSKHWDGHTEKDVTRLLSLLPPAQSEPEELNFVQSHKKIGVKLKVGQPERKKGRWKLLKNGDAICSECGFTQVSAWDMDDWDNFCHHCGSYNGCEQDE